MCLSYLNKRMKIILVTDSHYHVLYEWFVEQSKEQINSLKSVKCVLLQPPKPTITACDTDNTATSVKKKWQW